MTDRIDAIETLHTTLIDSRNGYDEALADAEGKGLTPLFREMIALRDAAIPRIAALLRNEGEQPDSSGSFMSTVHRTVISIRSMITGLDESILPSLISGEERILKTYDEAIAAAAGAREARRELMAQRGQLLAVIERMRRMELAKPRGA